MKKFRSLLDKHSGVVVYVVIAVTAVVLVALIQKRSDDADDHLRSEVHKIDQRFAQQARTIVFTGREAIRSGCQFDNERTKQIRLILRRSKRSVKVFYEEGQVSRSIYLRNQRELNKAIRAITDRDCERAAMTLKLDSSR